MAASVGLTVAADLRAKARTMTAQGFENLRRRCRRGAFPSRGSRCLARAWNRYGRGSEVPSKNEGSTWVFDTERNVAAVLVNPGHDPSAGRETFTHLTFDFNVLLVRSTTKARRFVQH